MKKAKYVILLGLLLKVMEQIDSILVDSNEQRIQHWKSQIWTIHEDVQDKMQELMQD